MSGITTHVLDTSIGRPAAGVRIALERLGSDGQWTAVSAGVTDDDGRLRTLTPEGAVVGSWTYRLVFSTREYFDRAGVASFYPHVTVAFETAADQRHYHVPLLISPFAYSTYRGS